MLFRRLFLAAFVVSPALFLAGCGGGGGAGPSVPTPTPTSTSSPTSTATPTPTAKTTSTPTPTATSVAMPVLATPVPLPEGHQIGLNYWPVGDTSTGGTGQTVDSLGCGDMSEDYHVHAHLSIFLNGKALAIPAAIGISNPTFLTKPEWPDGYAIYGDCHYNIHTHDTSGRLHVEAPTPGTFTLGQFFDIWGEPLSYTNVAGISGYPITVYVNDGTNLRRFTGDLSSIELVSHREITFVIGTPISQIPTYAWDSP